MSFWGEVYRRTERFSARDTETESRQVLEALRHVAGEVLDVGCGNGRHMEWLRAEGMSVRGVDFDPTSPGDAGDMRALPYDTGRFGGAYSLRNTAAGFSDGDLELVWAELARILRPGGLLFVTCTSAAWAKACLRRPVVTRTGTTSETARYANGRLALRRSVDSLSGELSVRLFAVDEWPTFLCRHGFESAKIIDTGPTTRITAIRTLTRAAT